MKARVCLFSAAGLAALGLYLTPYLALHQLRAAARAHDDQAFAALVDFAALRDSLKTGLRAKFIGDEPSPASVMGAEVAGALLGPMVDSLITPESLGRVLQGQPPAQAALPGAPAPAPEKMETRMGYESPSRFVFSIKPDGSDDDPVELVLHRDGLWGWKLTALRLS
ncbi:hypothetical protein BH11PSE10_BH11PSE10_14580 [soil metagenome]